MNESGGSNFILGNIIMGIALGMLLFIDRLWEVMGAAAIGLWIAAAGAGLYFLMKD